VHISIILCTYNRCGSLPRSLRSVLRSQMPAATSWEVLVVDNNSTDATPQVVNTVAAEHPGKVSYLFEPQPGKSHALNSAIRAAAGDILAFVDDDVVVEPEWLNRLTAPLADEQWMGSGGRICPDWKEKPPRWLPFEDRYALAPLAAFDLGTGPGELREPPFGTNMAFRKIAFEKYGGFRIDLGPRPNSQIRSEDTEFGARLLARGGRLWYEPSAIVYHPVLAERLQRSYFLAWWFDKGRAEVLEIGPQPRSKYALSGVSPALLLGLAKQTVRWALAVGSGRRFGRKTAVWQKAGQIVESRRQVASAVEMRRRSPAQS
jgi:glycosyltransferase involved in cell wall biosynthesis